MVWLIRIAKLIALLSVLYILRSLSELDFAHMGLGFLGLLAAYAVFLIPLWLSSILDMQWRLFLESLTLRIRGILGKNVEIRECKNRHYVEDVVIGNNNFHPILFMLEIVNKTGLQLSLIKQVTSIIYCDIPVQVFFWDKESHRSSNGVVIEGLVVGSKQNGNVKVVYNPHMSVLSLPPSNRNWGLTGRLVFNTIYGNISKDFSFNNITIPDANKWGEIRVKLNDFNKQIGMNVD